MRVAAIALMVVVVSCGRSPTPAEVPLPKPDGVPALRTGGPRSPRNASYRIEARLDPVAHQITATSTLTWTNTGANAVKELPFHLYLNGFKNEESLFMRSSRGQMRMSEATSNWGWIRVDSVVVGGSPAERVGDLVRKHLPDETVVELPQVVEPGATVEVTFKYVAQLPEVWARTGWKGDFHMVGQWFPKIGVRVGGLDDERWECRPFHANGEFFADFGTYDVVLTVPNTYVVAATGILASATESTGGMRTYTYRAEDVHDFAWMADPFMEMLTAPATVEDGPPVEVRVLYRPAHAEFAARHLEAAVGAIERFSASYLPYPWPIMTVIDPPMDAVFGAGGMEYPTLVTTGGDTAFARPGMRLPEFVTVHEVGHNWFQGILASNEAVEAWLDEGVNEWADGKVMSELYGPRTSGLDWMGWTADITELRRAVASDPASLPSPIASAATAFADNAAYGEASYASAMRALFTLEQTVGPQRFAAAMKAYVRAWAWKHPTGRDLFETLSKELGRDLSWFTGPVWNTVGGINLGIRTASCRAAHAPRGVFGEGSSQTTVTRSDAPDGPTYVCEVVVTNTGTVHVPVDIQLRFEDGSEVDHTWNDTGGKQRWYAVPVQQRSSRLAEVVLDPKGKLALDSPMRHHLRLEGDGAASLRAAAWFGATAQTLMQLVGP